MKVTKKYLVKWINERLPDVNTGLTLKDIRAINKNTNPVMGFVHKLLFIFETTDKFPIYIYSFYSMKEMTDHLIDGTYELHWIFREDKKWIQNSEIDLKKK